MIDSYLLLGLEIYHSVDYWREFHYYSDISVFFCTLTIFTYTLSYCSFCFANLGNLTMILHGQIISCSYLFEVPYAFCIWMSISFSKVRQFLLPFLWKNLFLYSMPWLLLFPWGRFVVASWTYFRKVRSLANLINFFAYNYFFLCHHVIYHEVLS